MKSYSDTAVPLYIMVVLVATIFVIIGTAITSNRDVTPKNYLAQYQKAHDLCEGNGGIEYLEPFTAPFFETSSQDGEINYGDVTCKNGSYFDL